jgi:hypothetical protein
MKENQDFLPSEIFILNSMDVKAWIAKKNRFYRKMTGKKRPFSDEEQRLLNYQNQNKKFFQKQRKINKTKNLSQNFQPGQFAADRII